ncbi:recombinase family protein [Tersicoccus sp. MR15.9]|uniref:recombinase family protein n=1 Tax=Tersicoccus mangrovi TaxID=3121635 RepID=UPI002FE58A00
MKIGSARVSTAGHDVTAQREQLIALGVDAERIHVDHGLTAINRARPGLETTLAASRCGDVLVVTRLDRLPRSVLDARAIADQLVERGTQPGTAADRS